MVTRIRNINPVQLGLVYATLYALLGIFFGFVIAIISMSAPQLGAAGMPHFGWFAIVIFPLLYGAFGFIAGIIVAFFYNIVAGWTGGIEITLSTAPTSTIPTTTY